MNTHVIKIFFLVCLTILSFSKAASWAASMEIPYGTDNVPVAASSQDFFLIRSQGNFKTIKKDEYGFTEKAHFSDCNLPQANLDAVKNMEKAISAYEACLQKHPEDVGLHLGISVMRFDQKKYDAALKSANAGLELAPHDARLLEQKADLLMVLGRFDEGLKLYDEVAEKSDLYERKRLKLKKNRIKKIDNSAVVADYLQDHFMIRTQDGYAVSHIYRDAVKNRALATGDLVYYLNPESSTKNYAAFEKKYLLWESKAYLAYNEYFAEKYSDSDELIKSLHAQVARQKSEGEADGETLGRLAAEVAKQLALYEFGREILRDKLNELLPRAAKKIAKEKGFDGIYRHTQFTAFQLVNDEMREALNELAIFDERDFEMWLSEIQEELKLKNGFMTVSELEILPSFPWLRKNVGKESKKIDYVELEKVTGTLSDYYTETGFAADVHDTLFKTEVVEQQGPFTFADHRIVWYGKVRYRFNLLAENPEVSIQWISPTKKIEHTDTAALLSMGSLIHYSIFSLEDKEYLAEGEWQVRIKRGDEILAYEKVYLAQGDGKTQQSAEPRKNRLSKAQIKVEKREANRKLIPIELDEGEAAVVGLVYMLGMEGQSQQYNADFINVKTGKKRNFGVFSYQYPGYFMRRMPPGEYYINFEKAKWQSAVDLISGNTNYELKLSFKTSRFVLEEGKVNYVGTYYIVKGTPVADGETSSFLEEALTGKSRDTVQTSVSVSEKSYEFYDGLKTYYDLGGYEFIPAVPTKILRTQTDSGAGFKATSKEPVVIDDNYKTTEKGSVRGPQRGAVVV